MWFFKPEFSESESEPERTESNPNPTKIRDSNSSLGRIRLVRFSSVLFGNFRFSSVHGNIELSRSKRTKIIRYFHSSLQFWPNESLCQIIRILWPCKWLEFPAFWFILGCWFNTGSVIRLIIGYWPIMNVITEPVYCNINTFGTVNQNWDHLGTNKN